LTHCYGLYSCDDEFKQFDSYSIYTEWKQDENDNWLIANPSSGLVDVICYMHSIVNNCQRDEKGDWSSKFAAGHHDDTEGKGSVTYKGGDSSLKWSAHYLLNGAAGCLNFEDETVFDNGEVSNYPAEVCWDTQGLCGFTADDEGDDDDTKFVKSIYNNGDKSTMGGGKCLWLLYDNINQVYYSGNIDFYTESGSMTATHYQDDSSVKETVYYISEGEVDHVDNQ
jgi:hypothetical protein